MISKTSLFLFVLTCLVSACSGQTDADTSSSKTTSSDSVAMADYYSKNKGDDAASVSSGTVSNGKLIHGKLMPYTGNNFSYFSSESYLGGRAYVTDKVRDITIAAFASLEKTNPGRRFCIMECSNRDGGKIWPHRTHQNGTSIDFMIPLQQHDSAYYGLDNSGRSHYLLTFDESGYYSADKTIRIDFETLAREILAIDDAAGKRGMKIQKVILKTELHDDLFATESGRKIQARGIYITQKLEPLINDLHDDHFHVDFAKQ